MLIRPKNYLALANRWRLSRARRWSAVESGRVMINGVRRAFRAALGSDISLPLRREAGASLDLRTHTDTKIPGHW